MVTGMNEQSKITYDRQSWMIGGERIFIRSAAVHYFRLTRNEWPELLEKAKIGGCNTIETYIPWNWHETAPGQWDFSGDKDLEHFLQLCADYQLYAIVRPGPYICAEWDFGGFPWWLSTEEGLEYRTMNEPYLKHVDAYLDQVIPRIAKYQLGAGGTVVMVQAENEFQAFGKPDQKYMEYLRDGIINRGIQVPIITCYGAVDGAVEWRNFWSNAKEHAQVLRSRFSDQPLGVLEFWIGWFEEWGGNRADQKTARAVERASYDLLKEGFTAINYYMFFGGTNFDHWGGRTIGETTSYMITSYDYDAPLDEYVQPTEKYRALQLFHQFIIWMEKALVDSVFQEERQLTKHLTLETRVSAHGDVHYLTNEDTERYIGKTVLPGQSEAIDFTVEPRAVLPVVSNKVLVDQEQGKITIDALSAYVVPQSSHSLQLYQEYGQISTLALSIEGFSNLKLVCELPNQILTQNEKRIHIKLYHGRQTKPIQLVHNGQVIMEFYVTDRTQLEAQMKQEIDQKYGTPQLQVPELKDWQYADENLSLLAEQGQTFEKPVDFSTFGQFSGHLLYSTQFESSEAGEQTIVFPRIEDPAQLFVNGKYAGQTRKIGAAIASIEVEKGRNVIQVLSQNIGRYNYSQTLGEPKGVSEAPVLGGEAISLVEGWQVEATGRTHSLHQIPVIEGRIAFARSWNNVDSYNGAVIVGYGLTRLLVNGKKPKLLFQNDSAWSRHTTPYSMVDISELLQEGENQFEYDIQGISSVKDMTLYVFHKEKQLLNWSIHPAGSPVELSSYQELNLEHAQSLSVQPRFFKTTFSGSFLEGQPYLKLKLRMDGMSKGSIWINGFGIGRFWQIGPQFDYKVPVSILKDVNEIVIYDELGKQPLEVSLQMV